MTKHDILEMLRKKVEGKFLFPKLIYLWLYTNLYPGDKRLLEYKDKFNGKRCFLVGTAPSLTVQDLELIKNEYSFSCNSIVKLYDKTQWRPTFFMVFDPTSYSLFQNEIEAMDSSIVIYDRTVVYPKRKDAIPVKGSPEHLMEEKKKRHRRKPYLTLSTDLMKKLVNGQSTMHSAIAVAVWMGFTEIFLLGIDCDYHIQHTQGAEIEGILTGLDAGYAMVQDFEDYKLQLAEMGIRIENCSRGGIMKVFPCSVLEDILNERNI